MPAIPAICDKCGMIFPSGFAIARGPNMMTNCKSGPCPSCGGEGTIPDGIYDALSETVVALTSGRIGASGLDRLVFVLQSAIDARKDPDTVKSEISKECPGLTKVSDIFPKSRTELYAFLAVLIALLALVRGQCSRSSQQSNPLPTAPVIINQAFNNVYQHGHGQSHRPSSDMTDGPKK